MTDYVIGIIDDDKDEILVIERSIVVNLPEDISEENVDFLEYSLNAGDRDPVDLLVKQVIDDAENKKVNALLIDYKLIVNQQNIYGSEIFQGINKTIPKFPVIMLTNLADGCYAQDYIDADKVYNKQYFFKIEEHYSKEKVNHLFLNIKKYSKLRYELNVNLNLEINNLAQNGYNISTLQNIADIESQLDDYVPIGKTSVEKALKISELKEIVGLIEKARGLLGDKDED